MTHCARRDKRRYFGRVLPESWLCGHIHAPSIQPTTFQQALLAFNTSLPRFPRHRRIRGPSQDRCQEFRAPTTVISPSAIQTGAQSRHATYAHVRYRERLSLATPGTQPRAVCLWEECAVLSRRGRERLFPASAEDGKCIVNRMSIITHLCCLLGWRKTISPNTKSNRAKAVCTSKWTKSPRF